MAAPTTGAGTLVTKSAQAGHNGYLVWLGEWAGTGEFTNEAIVDLSTLTAYTTSLKIVKGYIVASEGISAKLTLDASTDVPIAMHPLASTGRIDFDYSDVPGGGITEAGDLLLTTLSAASADTVFIYVEWKAY